MKDRSNGLETDTLYTVDCDVPDLECLLLRGGIAENGYEYHEVVGVEAFPPRDTEGKVGSQGGEDRAPRQAGCNRLARERVPGLGRRVSDEASPVE